MCVCVCMCVWVGESVLDEGFHVSSTVTVRTSAIHVNPSMSMREAPSADTEETANQVRDTLPFVQSIGKVRSLKPGF